MSVPEDDEPECQSGTGGESGAPYDPSKGCDANGGPDEPDDKSMDVGVPMSDEEFEELKRKAARPRRESEPQEDESADDA